MKHLEIEIRNKKGECIAGWGRLESIQDVKDCFFWRFNEADVVLSCKYLRYFNEERARQYGDKNYFNKWVSEAEEGLLFILSGYGFYEEAHVVEVER